MNKNSRPIPRDNKIKLKNRRLMGYVWRRGDGPLTVSPSGELIIAQGVHRMMGRSASPRTWHAVIRWPTN